MTSTTSPDLPSAPPGSRRRFELVRELGAGTFGTVYLADMSSLGGFKKRVALKMLNPQWEDGSDAGRRLRDEARLLGRLRHRNIVSVDDLVRIDGRWCVVMEYVSGVDLERLIAGTQQADQPLPPAAALEICAAVADALHVAYTGTDADPEPLAVVHRDIKPSNILLTASGEVKVLDFGIALARFDEREAKTERVRYGSIPYMSPERVLGEEETTAGDIYALGCVLYELLKAERFGRAELGPEQHRIQRQIALERLIDVPAPIHALLEESLHYDSDRRPSAANFASRAEQIARQLDSEHLRDYTRREIPPLQEQAVTQQPIISRVLSEESLPGTRSTRSTRSNPTLIFSDDADLLGESDDAAAIGLPLVPTPTAAAPQQGAAPTLAVDLDAATAATAAHPAPPSAGMRIIGGVSLLLASLVVLGIGLSLLQSADSLSRTDPLPPSPEPVQIITPLPPPPPPDPPTEALINDPEVTAVADPVPENPVPVQATTTTNPPPREVTTTRAVTPPPPPDPPPESTPPSTATLRSVKFTAPEGATNIQATCGAVSARGTGSATLRNLPAGACTVTAQIDGATLQGSVQVSTPGGFTCVANGDALACR